MKNSVLNMALSGLMASALLLSTTNAGAACAYQSIAYGQTVNGSLSTTDCTDDVNGVIFYADYYQFSGTAGDKIYIQQSSTSIDPWLMLIFPSGNFTYNDDGGGGTTARIPPASGYYALPESGTYLLEATSAISRTTGPYTLVLAKQAAAATLPGAPTNVTATAGNGSATVAFTPGPIGSGALVKYTATCGTISATGTASPIVVGGLTNGTAYTCTVSTTSTAGTSSLSAASNPVTPTAPVVPANGTAVEFYKADIDHYFMTADPAEATALDNNAAWKWVRTGKTFKVWLTQFSAPGNASPVCRFIGVFANGTLGSHFYTIDQAECAYVKGRTDWGWSYENNAFYAVKPFGGACPAGTSPVYRVFNNGMGGAPNHRYMTSQTDVTAMTSQGWASEGVAMCASGDGGSSASEGTLSGNSTDQAKFISARGYPHLFALSFVTEALSGGEITPLSPPRRIETWIYNDANVTSSLFDNGFFISQETLGAHTRIKSTNLKPKDFTLGMTEAQIIAVAGQPTCTDTAQIGGKSFRFLRYASTADSPVAAIGLVNGTLVSVSAGFLFGDKAEPGTDLCSTAR